MNGLIVLLRVLLFLVLWLVVWGTARRWCKDNESPKRYDYDVVAVGALFALTAGFFWRTISGDVYQPADGGDLVSFLYPTYRYAALQLAGGNLPLWNPTLYGGAPYIADIQAGYLYPPNMLLFLFNPDFPYQALQWMSILHIFWAGAGMYVLLRVMRWSDRPLMRVAALFGAIAFQFSDPLLIHMGNLNLNAVLSWMPWVFAAYVVALDRRKRSWAAVAGVLFAISVYAGHAQSTLYVGLALVVYTVMRALVDHRQTGQTTDSESSWQAQLRFYAVQYVAPLAMTVGIALFLAAPILLPAMELIGYTERSDFSYQKTVAYSLAPTQVIGLLTPGFFGRGPALHWGLWDRVELPYAGVATLLMAAAGLLLASARIRRQLWPWIGLGLFGFLTALGIYAIVHGWLTALLPLFDQFRAPARALILWTFALAVVGAVGADLVARRGYAALDSTSKPDALRGLLRTGALILAGIVLPLTYLALLLTQDTETIFLRTSIAALALTLTAAFWFATWALVSARESGWWSPNVFGLLMVGLLFFDLAATGAYTDISATDPTTGFQHDEIITFLHEQPDLFRIDSMTGIEAIWQPDTAALHGLQDVGGIANPLSLQHWHDLLEATGGRGTALYDMLNAEYVLVEDGTPLPDGKFELALDAQGPMAVYRNPNVMPRAWMVHEAELVADTRAALEMMQTPEFDPRTAAVLVADSLPPLSSSETDSVSVREYDTDSIAFDVQAGGDGLLVLSEVWYPGWIATVDGADAPVLAANGGLRAVPVPAGKSTVQLRFQPRPWRIGLLLAAAALLLLIGWTVYGLEKRRRKRS